MKAILCLFVAFFVATLAFGQETTEVRFLSAEPAPVFRISSLIVENSGLSLTSEMTEVLKKMELMTIAPATMVVPNGDLWLSWGGTEDFSRTFYLRARGTPIEVRLIGNKTLALWSTVAAGFGSLALVISAAPVATSASVPLAIPVISGAVALGGLVGLVAFSPRVEVQ